MHLAVRLESVDLLQLLVQEPRYNRDETNIANSVRIRRQL